MVKVSGYSVRIAEEVVGPPLRGFVHSSFAGAANLCFSDDFLLSLNASPAALLRCNLPITFSSPSLCLSSSTSREARQHAFFQTSPTLSSEAAEGLEDTIFPLLPNGLLLAVQAGEFPFSALRPGMPVLLGGERLYIEPLSCSLDFGFCPQWDPHISPAPARSREILRHNSKRLTTFFRQEELRGTFVPNRDESILELAGRICGRGAGLTPSGDDFLVGWMAAGWLLYGPQKDFLTTCQQILELASQRTHLLSRCWLACAADGDVAWPVRSLLVALLEDSPARLESAARNLLALGASSGFDLLQGISYGLSLAMGE